MSGALIKHFNHFAVSKAIKKNFDFHSLFLPFVRSYSSSALILFNVHAALFHNGNVL